MKYIEPKKVKVLMAMFFVTGALGIVVGLVVAPPSSTMIITFMGVINLGLGAFFTYTLMTQTKTTDKRKKKRKER